MTKPSASMIERVARASFKHWRENATRLGVHLDRPQTFDEMQEGERAFAMKHARAVIEAMREPTTEMVAAAGDPYLRDTESIYRSMIDAALSDKTAAQQSEGEANL
jgi:hypothetical protein